MSRDQNYGLQIGIAQWRRELEWQRAEIGRQRDRLIERMRADETSLLEALYRFEESRQAGHVHPLN